MQELSHNENSLLDRNWGGAHAYPPFKYYPCAIKFRDLWSSLPPNLPCVTHLAKTFRYGPDSIVQPPRQNPMAGPRPPPRPLPHSLPPSFTNV